MQQAPANTAKQKRERMFNYEICYTGGILDWETGEYYLNARYYDPKNAVFLEQDTYRGDTGDYPQWNLYAYCAGDPVNHSDPSGHWVYSLGFHFKVAAIIGVYFGLAINVDSKGYLSVTASKGIVVMTNAVITANGYIAGYSWYDSVDNVTGFGISMGVSFS